MDIKTAIKIFKKYYGTRFELSDEFREAEKTILNAEANRSTVYGELCYECTSEHRQLADWLKLLKEILDSGCCNDCKFKGMCGIEPKLGQMVRYNCHAYSRKGVNYDEG